MQQSSSFYIRLIEGTKNTSRTIARSGSWPIYNLKIMNKATRAAPGLWGANIVGFGDYHYVYESGREGDWFLAGFYSRAQNLALYRMGCFDKELLKKLGKHKTGKGCLYIKLLEAVDLKVFNELVEKSVRQVSKG